MSEEIKELAEFDTLLGKYWDAAYAEGKEGRAHDTPDNAAARTLAELHRVLKCMEAPVPEPISTGGMEPIAYIEHHKAGDNLNWEPVNHSYAKDAPLYSAEQLATLQSVITDQRTVIEGFAKALNCKTSPESVRKLYNLKEQLATQRAKLEQAEKDKSELVTAIKKVRTPNGLSMLNLKEVDEVLAKYEEKKS